jgi:hypothetical protein
MTPSKAAEYVLKLKRSPINVANKYKPYKHTYRKSYTSLLMVRRAGRDSGCESNQGLDYICNYPLELVAFTEVMVFHLVMIYFGNLSSTF